MRLRTKLLLAQLPLGLSLGVVALLAIRTVDRLGDHAERILTDNYRSVLAAQRMTESIERLDSAALFLVAGQRDKGLAQARAHRPQFEAELRVELQNVTEQGEDAAARHLERAWRGYGEAFDRLVGLASADELAAAYFRELEPSFLEVKRHAEDILAINQDAMVRKSDEGRLGAERMSRTLGGVSVAALLAGVLASGSLTARLLRPLGGLSEAARRLGRGELDARALPLGQDEIAELAREFNEMAAHLAEYSRSTLGEMLAAQESSQAAIDSLPDPVVVLGADGRVTTLNAAAEALLEQRPVPGGGSPLEHADPAIRAALARVTAHVLSGKGSYVPKGFEEAIRVAAPDGERSLLPRASPLRKAGDGIAGVTVVLQDVTRLRRFDELKNDLVSTVAHEFRTPLTSLRMAIHLCLEGAVGPLTEKQLDLLHAGRDDCERLQRIVDDLLDLARLQSGKLELSTQPLAPEALLEAAAATLDAESAQREIALDLQVTPSLDPVAADPDRIALVLSNLVSNAVRFSPSPGVVRLRALPANGAVRFEVEDAGPGLAPEHRERVFDRFFRVPGSPPGGAGLGLSIAEEIVAAHGGRIGVVSEVGHGSTFWFELPLAARPPGRDEVHVRT